MFVNTLKDTYFAVFLSVSEDLIISSRESTEKLCESNIVCVCVRDTRVRVTLPPENNSCLLSRFDTLRRA